MVLRSHPFLVSENSARLGKKFIVKLLSSPSSTQAHQHIYEYSIQTKPDEMFTNSVKVAHGIAFSARAGQIFIGSALDSIDVWVCELRLPDFGTSFIPHLMT